MFAPRRAPWRTPAFAIALLTSLVAGAAAAVVGGGSIVATTERDFIQLGTQPNQIVAEIASAETCASCHGGFDPVAEPALPWLASMMGQSMRDPMFHAAMSIAQQDADGSGELCIRCHSPGGWLEGRSTPPDGSALQGKDFEGVTCHVCHRLVDPIAAPENPAPDTDILAALGADVPAQPHNGQLVIDPQDRRRGPFELSEDFFYHSWEKSSFHSDSMLCANCHDVSNPVFTRVGGAEPKVTDTYVANDLDSPHPTQHTYDLFPVERTWSEWSKSDFAEAPVEMGGLFGGNKTAVSTCQDCHMPDTSGVACAPPFGGIFRDDLPTHHFAGANSWVLNAILDLDQSLLLYGANEVSQLTPELVDAAIDRNVDMLGRAAELVLFQDPRGLRVRVINNTGHKLPTGYPEGRRMWLNVQFLDAQGTVIDERGHYDFDTAELETSDTKVYEGKLGLDDAMAAVSGVPAGESFHFVLNNAWIKDNRIPPRGFTNAEFESIQAAPVAYEYADGQYWDRTQYEIPCGAASAKVTLYYQTTSKEYVEFLRDANHTDAKGQLAYDLWATNGKSAPVVMEQETLHFTPRLQADLDTISFSAGGSQSFCLTAGAAHAGDLYFVLGSASGGSPSFPLGPVEVPLAFDAYTLFTATNPNVPPLGATFGTLDSFGNAAASFDVASGTPALPALLAAQFRHAFVVLDAGTADVESVSNGVGLTFMP